MSAPIIITKNWYPEAYDMVIDVRAPVEFAQDHIVGAVNMPVLSNAERIEIGTLYKQSSPFAARKRGAVLVSQNIARHIDTKLLDLPADFSPLIHCWRGGQRSRAFAHILSEIGWRCHLLEGGYKAYRRDILDGLKADFSGLSLVVIAGRTGSAKTDILAEIKNQGGQIIDLEGLARHRGSLLGRWPDSPQPSQRFFESSLIDACANWINRAQFMWNQKVLALAICSCLLPVARNDGQPVNCDRNTAERVTYLRAQPSIKRKARYDKIWYARKKQISRSDAENWLIKALLRPPSHNSVAS